VAGRQERGGNSQQALKSPKLSPKNVSVLQKTLTEGAEKNGKIRRGVQGEGGLVLGLGRGRTSHQAYYANVCARRGKNPKGEGEKRKVYYKKKA